ncbi:MAG: hypothetical protein K0B08_02605 [Bacteroidales bacterium]|nr:hypothetical protein [Bacteroidales bacterium]
MKKFFLFFLAFHTSFFSFSQIQSPGDHFGFEPGEDRMLFNYEPLTDYLKKLDEASGMVKMLEIGRSPMNKPIYICFISSEENINNLDRLKEINRKLALDPNLTDEEQQKLVQDGKVFVLATLSMHSSEVAPSQTAPTIAYELITNSELKTQNSELKTHHSSLNEVVFMMVPCHNPDGMDMVVDYYNQYKGTKYEGSYLPRVYHKYVGHDNNRDFISLSQSDTRAIAAIYNKDWYPQVMVEKHQMGATGVRYFVPPPHDPIAENVDAGIFTWIGLFGSNMINDMTARGLKEVTQRYLFDDYWPGSTETCIWKNVIGMLTEAASVNVASPVYIEPNEIAVWGKGLSEHKKSINMPDPWPGGWWRLSDLVEYERASTYSMLRTAAQHKKDILKFRNDLCRKEVMKGKTQPPYYYIIPQKQHDAGEMVRMVNLLMEHGVDIYEITETVKIGDYTYYEGDLAIPLAQPFRGFIKEVLEDQEFPVRHYTPGGEIIRPYDITSWSLPLHNGVTVREIKINVTETIDSKLTAVTGPYTLKEGLPTELWGLALPVERNESFKAAFLAGSLGFRVDRLKEDFVHNGRKISAGSFIAYGGSSKQDDLVKLYGEFGADPVFLEEKPSFHGDQLKIPRIALVETFRHDMDAGWTRFLFDTYHIPYKVVDPRDFEKIDFVANYDVIVFPSVNKDILKEGKMKSEGTEYFIGFYTPEYNKGMGEKGLENLMTFLDKGGVIVSWGASTDLFTGTLKIKRGEKETEEFRLPFRNISSNLKELYVPGAFIAVDITQGHSLSLGMPEKSGVFYRGNPVFNTSLPNFDMDRRVIVSFPEKNILKSGYIEKEELLSEKPCMIWIKKGKGQLVLFAFNPQFRASTAASYKLLFNSLLLDRH